MDEVPRVVRRFGVDPQHLAIGGISMGGFGA
jgi:S-formylglutathione hydrolase FrmB